MRNILTILALFCLLCSCCMSPEGHDKNVIGEDTSNNGIYHWKTTFNFTQEDSLFMENHRIGRLYIRMFDVTLDNDETKYKLGVIPAGTTSFRSKIPHNYEIIPTVYIALPVLYRIEGEEEELAELIVKRIKAMCSYNEFPEIHEIQYDCDWTSNTADSYGRLCEHTKKLLAPDSILLSGTIRLHQVEDAVYPFDKGVLMVYNTDNFRLTEIENSIINPATVSAYLSEKRIRKFIEARKTNCSTIDVAYPTYNWGVLFKDGKFSRLINDYIDYVPQNGESLRVEESSISLIMEAKQIVEDKIGRVCSGNIIYHLDNTNISKYSYDEIENILR